MNQNHRQTNRQKTNQPQIRNYRPYMQIAVFLALVYSGVFTGKTSKVQQEVVHFHVWRSPSLISKDGSHVSGPIADKLNNLHSVMGSRPTVSITVHEDYKQYREVVTSGKRPTLISMDGPLNTTYTWIGPIYEPMFAFYAMPSKETKESALTILETAKIGLVWCDGAAIEMFGGIDRVTINKYPTKEALFQALEEGTIELALYPEVGLESTSKSKYVRMFAFKGSGIYLGFPPGTGKHLIDHYTEALTHVTKFNIIHR